MRAFHTCSGICCKRGLADFRDHRILRGADFAEEAQGEVFGFVSHKRNVSLARLAGAHAHQNE
jgi:hypothetical protein